MKVVLSSSVAEKFPLTIKYKHIMTYLSPKGIEIILIIEKQHEIPNGNQIKIKNSIILLACFLVSKSRDFPSVDDF